MTVLVPPQAEPIVDNNKVATLNWQAFFESLAAGDSGTSWTPTFQGLTEVGTATKTGVYYRISDKLAVFRIVITPSTSTSATLGTTYCDNFPLVIAADGYATSCSSYTASAAGVTSSDKRIYTGTWVAITTPVTITGLIEVR